MVLCPIKFLYKLGKGKIDILLGSKLAVFRPEDVVFLIEHLCAIGKSLGLAYSSTKRNQHALVLKERKVQEQVFPQIPCFSGRG